MSKIEQSPMPGGTGWLLPHRHAYLGELDKLGYTARTISRHAAGVPERVCAVELSVPFLAEDGTAAAVESLSAEGFSVESRRLGTRVADAEGLGLEGVLHRQIALPAVPANDGKLIVQRDHAPRHA